MSSCNGRLLTSEDVYATKSVRAKNSFPIAKPNPRFSVYIRVTIMLKLYTHTGWMRGLLLVAGFYNLLYGIGMFVFHLHPINLASLGLPEHPMLWQIISVMVGVYAPE